MRWGEAGGTSGENTDRAADDGKSALQQRVKWR